MSEPPATIVYRLRDRQRGLRPGAHRGRDTGGLGTFRDQVPFLRLPDARRIDLRASLRDPLEGTWVRRFETRSTVDVWVLVDLSASMRFRGAGTRMDLARDLCCGLAASATRIGDGFGLIAADEAVRDDLTLPATRRTVQALNAVAKLAEAEPRGRGAEGLVQGARRLAGRPKLVFVISDFRWPEAAITALFEVLVFHDVVPVLLADSAEDAALPAWGLLELDDLEGAGRRVVFMRPALRRRWREREQARLAALTRISGAYGRPPFCLEDRFDAEALSRHLLST